MRVMRRVVVAWFVDDVELVDECAVIFVVVSVLVEVKM